MTKNKGLVGIVVILSLMAGFAIGRFPTSSAFVDMPVDQGVKPLVKAAQPDSSSDRELVAKEVGMREGLEVEASSVDVVGSGVARVSLPGRAVDIQYGHRWRDCPAETTEEEVLECLADIKANPTGFVVLGYTVRPIG